MAKKSGEMSGVELVVATVSLAVLGGTALAFGTNRARLSGADEGGEYIWMHDEEGYGVIALPMTDRTLYFSPTPFTDEERVYVDELTADIIRNRELMKAERTRNAATARIGEPYIPNTTLDASEAAAVVNILKPLGLVCPEGAATSLYKPEEPGAEDIQQDICIDYSTAQVIDGRVSVALAPEPKIGIPNPQDVYLAFDERSDVCVWMANRYFPFINSAILAEEQQAGIDSSTLAVQYDLALRMNKYFPDDCDSVAGDAAGLAQLDTSRGVLTQ